MNAVQLHSRPSGDYEIKLAHTLAVLTSAAAEHGSRIVQATSLGAEDMVLTHLIAAHHLPIAIATLDTGKLHRETLELIDRAEAAWGLAIERFAPPPDAVVHFVARHGERAMFDSVELRKACCALRKLQPLARMLDGRSAWITGLRREQSEHRAEVPFSEREANGRLKLNPLADWTWGDVWHHIGVNGVPYNPLHDRFFPSIGCEPCTRAIALGEDFRAGRWWWEQEGAKECGLHVNKPEGATA
ncbi:MAG TPA: phosphoadenylyl-sulfate reductase [Burkholderiaceae bacterium]|nr:phosphoadenylyl-sulfate reductase [Burkholderiaceae bacterium]